MASFDPSVIASIGQNMPNIPLAQQQARASAVTLRDMLDQEQLNRLRLSGAQEQAQRETKLREVLSGPDVDVSTQAGVTRAAARLSQAGFAPEAMNLMRSGQSLALGSAQARLSQYQLLNAQNDLVGNSAAGLMNQYTSLVQGGTSPALATMIMQPKYQDAIKALSAERLPDGSPALDATHLRAIESNPTFNPEFVGTVAMNSARARAILKQQTDVLKSQAEIENANARTRAIESGKLVPVQNPDGSNTYAPSSQAVGKPVGRAGQVSLTPEAQSLAADMGAHGVPFPSGLGFGQTMRAQILNRMAQQGVTWQDVRQNGLGYFLTRQESGIVGKQNARIQSAATAITQPGGFADQVMDASEATDFPSFKAAARAKGFALDEIQDPQYATLKTALLGLASEYAIVLARGGQNVSSQDAARSLLTGVSSFPAMRAKIDQAVKEMRTTESASYQTVSGLVTNPAGAAPQARYTPPAGTATAAPAPAALPMRNAEGWTLMEDAAGDKAYVSPDGKQFQAVP